MLPNRMNILTDHRVLEVQQVRIVDLLAMLLHSMTRNEYRNDNEDIEDFMDLYGIRETCAMLVQILSDINGLYLFTRKIEDKLTKNRRRES